MTAPILITLNAEPVLIYRALNQEGIRQTIRGAGVLVLIQGCIELAEGGSLSAKAPSLPRLDLCPTLTFCHFHDGPAFSFKLMPHNDANNNAEAVAAWTQFFQISSGQATDFFAANAALAVIRGSNSSPLLRELPFRVIFSSTIPNITRVLLEGDPPIVEVPCDQAPQIPTQWRDAAEQLLADLTKQSSMRRICIVLGRKGVGKSTWSRFFANLLVSRGREIAWLDLDPGQSQIAPPRFCRCLDSSFTLFPALPLVEMEYLRSAL